MIILKTPFGNFKDHK